MYTVQYTIYVPTRNPLYIHTGVAQGPGNLEKVPEEILALFPGDSRSFFPENYLKFQN